MEEEVLQEIRNHISEKCRDPPALEIEGSVHRLEKENFVTVPYPVEKPKICFIDGGNSPLISSPGLRVEFMRIYSSVFSSLKKSHASRDELFLVLCQEADKVRCIEMTRSGKKITFYLEMPASSTSLELAANRIRRLKELLKASEMTRRLGRDDVIVLDGSLEGIYPEEIEALEKLKEESVKSRIRICGISKTTSLLTTGGLSVPYCLTRMAPEGKLWSYEIPNVKGRRLFFAKLNRSSRHVLRVETFIGEGCLGSLLPHCKDPVLPGYPYGLIDADRFARVSNSERDLLRTRLLYRDRSVSDMVQTLEADSDAHSVLDHIS